MLKRDKPFVDGAEGATVPEGLPPVVDAHVHIFPRRIFSSVWKWFDRHAYPIRYRIASSDIVDFLLSRGVRHVVALQYAHKPGMARELNRYMADKCREFGGRVTGMATVFPGEENAVDILQEAFDAGLRGLKLHAHVQCFDMNADAVYALFDCCRKNEKPIVMHVGREPSSKAYRCDPHTLCSAGKLEAVLKTFPGLAVCVPHLGFDETSAYRSLVETYDHLWLDTTMVLADYFHLEEKVDLGRYRADRILYGSDFPSIPYAWDRELRVLAEAGLPPDTLERICGKNAEIFFNLKPERPQPLGKESGLGG